MMILAESRSLPYSGFWTKLKSNAILGGAFLFAVAIGAMGQSIIDRSTALPWLHQQAAAVPVLRAEAKQNATVAKCEHAAHVAATNLAIQSVIADTSPTVPQPSLSDVTKDHDCPAPSAVK